MAFLPHPFQMGLSLYTILRIFAKIAICSHIIRCAIPIHISPTHVRCGDNMRCVISSHNVPDRYVISCHNVSKTMRVAVVGLDA